MTIWTEERTAELRRLCETARSLTEIAREMGLTKNQVCGKLARKKFARPQAVQDRYNGGGWGKHHGRLKTGPQPLTVAPREALQDRPSGGCRWPMWGNGSRHSRNRLEKPTHIYCDAKRTEGKSYCPDHCAVAYETSKHREAA